MDSHWQSFKTGQIYTTERHCLAREDILAFAEEFDPQAYHLDESAAQASFLAVYAPVAGKFVRSQPAF